MKVIKQKDRPTQEKQDFYDELQKIIFDLQLIFLSPPADGAGGILATLWGEVDPSWAGEEDKHHCTTTTLSSLKIENIFLFIYF